MADTVITQPMPMNPNDPTACGPSSHSPLPIEMPRAMRLGPMTNLTICQWSEPGDLEHLLGLGQVVDAERWTAHAQLVDFGLAN